MTVSDLIKDVKLASNKWMKDHGVRRFAWQGGYGAFSFGESQKDQVVRYVLTQEEHHRVKSFQEEFREFLEKYRIPYDEKYMWE